MADPILWFLNGMQAGGIVWTVATGHAAPWFMPLGIALLTVGYIIGRKEANG